MNGTDDVKASGRVTVVDTFRLNWWLLASARFDCSAVRCPGIHVAGRHLDNVGLALWSIRSW